MGIKQFKPRTPGSRFRMDHTFEEITKDTPEKSLLEPLKKHGGRNCHGRMTARGIGGGHKQFYRIIDFKRDKSGVPAKVAAIEYDPNRSARIALLHYKDGEKRYILAPNGLQVGQSVMSGPEAPTEVGNAMPLKSIPMSLPVHAIELNRGRGAQMVRTAGASAQLMAKEGEYVQIKLPSGEVRRVHQECYATIGQVGNLEHDSISLGKAGRTRWLGRRSISRAMCRNPIDHPMGGGQGKSKGGGGWHHPCSPWGQPAKGYKTRKKHKSTSRFIVQDRRKK